MRSRKSTGRVRLFIALVLCLLPMSCFGATTVRVMGFSGSSDWPLLVGQAQGFFAQRGITIDLVSTRGSASQMRALLAGEIEIALTAMDNVVAFDARDHADIVAVMGINRGGRARLIASRDIHSIAGLRHRVLAVDAVDTGYAFVLREILRRGGLEPADYSLASTGGSPDRLAALEDGHAVATLLNAPIDAQAEARGFNVLASASDILPQYQGSVAAVRRAWAREHADTVVAFIRAYVESLEWLRDPAHRDAAIALLLQRLPRLDAKDAARSYADLLDPTAGALSPRAAIDVEGVRVVLDLRARYGARADALERDPFRYYDASYYQRALAHD